MRPILSLVCVLFVFQGTSYADNPQSTQPATRESSTQPADELPVVTQHEITIEGKTIKYSAAAGLVTLKDDADKARARMFYIAYTVPGETNRPVTFVFNGGPGAAAIWLHLGTAGPQRIKLNDDGTPLPPPYALEKNDFSWLDLTDLVFIDPVGTGYSRPEPEKGKEFYSVQGDVQSVADFIRIYLTKNNRWNATKFIAGESYGTTRAAGLSEYLHDRFGIDLNGVILVSTVLNFQTLSFDAGNDTVYPLWLPTYAATAWYHKRIASDKPISLSDFVAQARKWAETDYATALIRGNSLNDAERAKIEGELAGFTGLPIDFIRKSDLRIAPYRFQKELLSDQRKVIGRMDGRLTAHDADPLSGGPEFDPSIDGYTGVFSGTFNQYIRQELKYENEQVYEFLSPRVGPWDWGKNNGYVNVAANLRKCMTKLPSLKVFVAQGYYDFATPFAASDYTLDQLPLSKELQSNITRAYYEGGHMMYLNKPSLEKLKRDLSTYYSKTRANAP